MFDNVQVFEVCGQPTLGGARARRKADPYSWYRDDHVDSHASLTASDQLESLMRDIRERLLTTRNFFTNLPDSLCSQLAAAPFELTNCWNGVSVSRFGSFWHCGTALVRLR